MDWFDILVGVLAALANQALDARRLAPVLIGSLAVVLISSLGSLRSVLPADVVEPTNISLLVTPDTYHVDDYLDEVWMYTRGVEHSGEQRERAIGQINRSLKENLRMVRQEAEHGSDLMKRVTPEIVPPVPTPATIASAARCLPKFPARSSIRERPDSQTAAVSGLRWRG